MLWTTVRDRAKQLRPCSILIPAALLLAISVWLLQPQACLEHSGPAGAIRVVMAIRQGIFGVLALLVAFGMGRYLPCRQAIRLWWVPLALFGVVCVAAPLSVWARAAGLVHGSFWWQRSPGWVVSLLALIGGMTFTLPRYTGGGRRGVSAFAGLLLFIALVPLVFHNLFAPLLVLFGILGLALVSVARGRRLWAGLAALASTFVAVLAILFKANRGLIEQCLLPGRIAEYQLMQSLLSIHAGALTGCDLVLSPSIPEGLTDFVFGQICDKGGLVTGLTVLLLTALLVLSAWRVVARRRQARARSLAAGCAAALTMQPLLHVAVNIGVWPVLPVPFPFLSYGPLLLLLDGVLLGILLSLDRDDTTEPPVPSCWPTILIQAGVCVLLALFVFRLGFLVFGQHPIRERWEWKLDEARHREEAKHKPVRGRILDSRNRVLAQQGTAHILCADPSRLVDSPDRNLLDALLRLAGMEAETFTARTVDTTRVYVRLKRVNAETAEAVRRLNIDGVHIENVVDREYPAETPLAHLAGFTVMHDPPVGGGGVEYAREALLAAGGDVRLTLDTELQTALYAVAEAGARNTQARQVQIMVINPQTGAIRAAVQVPAAHGATRGNTDLSALTWRSAIDVFEPGGLLQPLVIATAVETKVIAPDALIDCEDGTWTYCGTPLHDPGCFGELTPSEILVKAGNIGMAKIGLMMGEAAVHQCVLDWGVNRPCTIGLGAGSGTVHAPSRWSKLEITRIPIGHAVAFSLMQMVRAYTTFFNDGRMVEPYLIDAERSAEGRAWQLSLHDAPVAVVSPEAARLVRTMLEQVIEKGTGRGAHMDGLAVFGKTALVQKPLEHESGYAPDKFQTAFIGGFETHGEPCLIAVWFDEPNIEGHANPAPALFRDAVLTVQARSSKVPGDRG